MTFTDIVSRIQTKLNLSSTDSQTRIGLRVNETYRKVTSGIGLDVSRRKEIVTTYDPVNDGTLKLPDIDVPGLEKIITVRFQVINGRPIILEEHTYDEIVDNRDSPIVEHEPIKFAVVRMGPRMVTITLDSYPNTTFTMQYEGLENTNDLVGAQEPMFPESFHDVLLYMPLAEEYFKMEKPQMGQYYMKEFDDRLSELRYFIAKSQWLDIIQGKNTPSRFRGATVVTTPVY